MRKQVGEVVRLRSELAAIKAQVWAGALEPSIWDGMTPTLPLRSVPPLGNAAVGMLRIPDLRDIDRRTPPPADPAPGSLPGDIPEGPQTALLSEAVIEESRAYLVETATPGYTMMRQGVSLSIERLHPGFAVKLAEAVRRARAEGMTYAGIFSAYRPPAFGVGGFRDKFDSLHSYGLATDVTGIGAPGSPSAHRWNQIVQEVGLYLPYGPGHRVEFNHTQFVPAKIAPREWRETITADGPNNLREMWLATGADPYVTEPPAIAVAGGADVRSPDADSGQPESAAPTQGD